MSDKKALKGLKSLNVFEVIKNTEAAYEVGEILPIPSLQGMTKEDQREEYTIYADDTVYASGTDYKYTDLEITLAELGALIESKLTGGAFNEEKGVFTAKNLDVAPEFALTYAALSMSGYRLFRHPVVKLMKVKVDHTTKGENNDIAPYTLSFRAMARKIDGAYREQKDVEITDELAWIKAIESLPIGGAGE